MTQAGVSERRRGGVSDELWVWLEQVRVEREEAQVCGAECRETGEVVRHAGRGE